MCHHQTITAYRMRRFGFFLLSSSSSSSSRVLKRIKQSNRLLFVEEIYNWYGLCTHIGMLVWLRALFLCGPDMVTTIRLNCQYPKKVIFLRIQLEIWSASRWAEIPFFLNMAIVWRIVCLVSCIYNLSANHHRKRDKGPIDCWCKLHCMSIMLNTYNWAKKSYGWIKTSGRNHCGSWSIIFCFEMDRWIGSKKGCTLKKTMHYYYQGTNTVCWHYLLVWLSAMELHTKSSCAQRINKFYTITASILLQAFACHVCAIEFFINNKFIQFQNACLLL